MTDQVLKEAYDKLTAIEEAIGPEEAKINELVLRMRSKEEANELEENSVDNVHDKAIDLLDDMLFNLGEEEQYGEKGDILRYAIGRLQEVGLGR